MFDSFSLISSFGMKAISITFLLPPRPPRPDPPFPVAPSRALLASNGENIGQAIIGLLLYGYIARGAAPSQTESNPRTRTGRARVAARRGVATLDRSQARNFSIPLSLTLVWAAAANERTVQCSARQLRTTNTRYRGALNPLKFDPSARQSSSGQARLKRATLIGGFWSTLYRRSYPRHRRLCRCRCRRRRACVREFHDRFQDEAAPFMDAAAIAAEGGGGIGQSVGKGG